MMITAAYYQPVMPFDLFCLFFTHIHMHICICSWVSFSFVFVCVQTAGGGGGYGKTVSPNTFFEEPVQGAQCQLQPDDPVLQKTGGAAFSPHAGLPHLHFSLLLSHAGWGPVCPLGLEELSSHKRKYFFLIAA